MSNTQPELGMNRTGVATSPILTTAMLGGTEELTPDGSGDARDIAAARAKYAREADPIGSVPPPLTPKGLLKSAAQALKGEHPARLVDKLGERLAFERAGVRVYEAILSKFDAFGSYEGGPSREALQKILEDEFGHFALLQQALKTVGADPTVMTPSADLHATISKGAMEVMVEPRTTLAQSLEAALVLELADNDCWLTLTDLASKAGHRDMVERFSRALADEQHHLALVRRWVTAAQGL